MTHRKITTIEGIEHRIETGALKINSDWNGLFIRGDDCIALAFALDDVIDGKKLEIWDVNFLKAIRNYIRNDVLTRG